MPENYTPLTDADLRILTDFSGQGTLGGVCRQAAAEIRARRASQAQLTAALRCLTDEIINGRA